MTATQIWLAIFGMVAATALTRTCFLIGGERTVLPDGVLRALRYAPAAALAAIVVPDVAATAHGISLGLSNHPLWATLAGLGWFLWRRGMVGTIAVGMLVYTAMRLWL